MKMSSLHFLELAMKKIIYLATALAALASVQAHAQATNFVGFSLGANAEFDGTATNGTDGTSDAGKTTGLGLQAKYDWDLGNNFVLGLGATASTGNRQAGTYTNGTGAYTNNRYSLDLMPGYALTKDLLVYGKVSSVAANAAANDGTSTAAVQGLGYGVGVRSMITPNAYVQAGYDYYKFNDVTFATGTTASLKGNVLSLGIGYKF
jgi:outer membrane immunogenic protein